MNNVFTAKLLNNLRNKKGDKGFTLIELLVVVIIIGVLAAVALPNLLAQVGKARETEGKNAVGTINRSQQAYHFEAATFSPAIDDAGIATVTNPLGVAIESEYFTFDVDEGTAALGTQDAQPVNANANGTRGYAGAISFGAGSGLYATVLCQGSGVGTTPAVADISPATEASPAVPDDPATTDVNEAADAIDAAPATCGDNGTVLR